MDENRDKEIKKSKSKYRRTKGEKLADLPVIAEQFMRGETHEAIRCELCKLRANENYISRSTITRDVKKIVDAWKKRETGFINDRMYIELMKLDKRESDSWNIIDELRDAWQKSKDFIKTTDTQIGRKEKKSLTPGHSSADEPTPIDDGTPDYMEQRTDMEKTPGELRYLSEMRLWFGVIDKIAERRSKLLGFEKITVSLTGEVEVNHKTTQTVINIVPTIINDEIKQGNNKVSNMSKSLLEFEDADYTDTDTED